MDKKSDDPNYYKRFKRRPKYVYVDDKKYLVLKSDESYFYLTNGKKIKKSYTDIEPGIERAIFFVDFRNRRLVDSVKYKRKNNRIFGEY